jgi:hypothetical protein
MSTEKTIERLKGDAGPESEGLPARQEGASPGRNHAIDFVKGILVLSMVVYHSLNYTINGSPAFGYLRFIALGFICISGFVITRVLAGKYRASSRVLYGKLLVKGVKLILLFTIVNLLISALLGSDSGTGVVSLRGFAENLRSIYLTGSGTRAAFGILLPIGYLMIVSPLALAALKLSRLMPYVLVGALGAYCVVRVSTGDLIPNEGWLIAGLLGVAIGSFPPGRLDFSPPLKTALVIASLVLYIGLASFFDAVFLLNVFGTLSTLALFWLVGSISRHANIVILQIDKLGRYSLFSYMMQIMLLQVIARLGSFSLTGLRLLVLAFFEALVLTVASVILLDQAVRQSKTARAVYGWVFS